MTRNKKILYGIIGPLATIFLFFLFYKVVREPSSYTQDLIEFRESKNRLFLERPYPESPIAPALRKDFKGLAYFPLNLNFIFRNAKFERFTAAQFSTDGPPYKAGWVTFQYNKQNHRLLAYWQRLADSEKDLFIPFRDPTNGKSTYEGGRYLNAILLNDSIVELDFNKSYNPYCAYSYEFKCPIPPPENQLPFAVEAGEKKFPYPVYKPLE
ncbi:MAG: DUF1684 domain-containing protein [Bacteroidia bacterium]|nr:DUF1684 domain-containing protein [Bacteroidia bacterium]MDW8158433.1 DUF1684 domain-containing protein [Bacteroidia bacterium]